MYHNRHLLEQSMGNYNIHIYIAIIHGVTMSMDWFFK